MQLNGSQIFVEVLCEQGVDTIFGYPGGAVLNLYDELYKNADRITHVLTAHEQGAAHAADGYARATGRTGVVLATSGPGATNLVTGIATLLQTIGVGPIGARLPIPLECSFVFVAPGIALGAQYGLAAFTGACLVGSIITTILWTGLHKQLSILFKPYITGAVVMALGLSLCSVGIGYCAGGVGSADYGDPINLLLAAGTIIIMVLLNYFLSLIYI